MSIHILAIALLLGLAVALVLALKVGAHGDRKPTSPSSPAISTTAQSERVVVMPTAGACTRTGPKSAWRNRTRQRASRCSTRTTG